MLKLNIVLYQPEIPQNTGNIARTCAALEAGLHLIRPLGFSLRDRYLKRAGLDYWSRVKITLYDNLEDFFRKRSPANLYFFTKTTSRLYTDFHFSGEVFFVFGRETAGLPPELLEEYRDRCVRIPMKSEARSLNLSNAVAIAAYEAHRQNGFKDLCLSGRKED